MHILWDNGPSTVREVQSLLNRDYAYTTVQTVLNILVRKKRSKRQLSDRAYIYTAAISRERVMKATTQDLVKRMFGGSVEALLVALVDSGPIEDRIVEGY